MVRDPRRFGSRRDPRRTGPRRDRDVGHFGRDETRRWYVPAFWAPTLPGVMLEKLAN